MLQSTQELFVKITLSAHSEQVIVVPRSLSALQIVQLVITLEQTEQAIPLSFLKVPAEQVSHVLFNALQLTHSGTS